MPTVWKEVDVPVNHHVGISFRVPEDFELIKKLGSGAFATAAAFKSRTTGQKVSVKKIADAFTDIVDGKRHLREVSILQQLKHDNIISIIDMFMPEYRTFNDIYIVQELMDSDLHKVIRSHQVLEEEHCRYFVYQILCAVQYLHSANLIHRDLKPANVLVNKNCDVKVCDFGLARAASCGPGAPQVTDYVVTRWWRAPEVVLLPSSYNEKVDIWAVGCILGELMGRKPLFQGTDHVDQIRKIFQIIGTPSEEDLVWLPADTENPARKFVARMKGWPKQPWSHIYPKASQLAIDTLEQMLAVNVITRVSAKDAMLHAYFSPLYMDGDLREADAPVCCAVDRIEPTKHWLQNAMYAECCKFHPEDMQSRVVQLHPTAIAEDGRLAVVCHGVGGDLLATIISEPGHDISSLRAQLSSQLDEPMEHLQLLRADGRLLGCCDAEEHQDVRLVLAA